MVKSLWIIPVMITLASCGTQENITPNVEVSSNAETVAPAPPEKANSELATGPNNQPGLSEEERAAAIGALEDVNCKVETDDNGVSAQSGERQGRRKQRRHSRRLRNASGLFNYHTASVMSAEQSESVTSSLSLHEIR